MLPGISVHCVRACLNLWSYGFLHEGYAAVPFRFTREILCLEKTEISPLSCAGAGLCLHTFQGVHPGLCVSYLTLNFADAPIFFFFCKNHVIFFHCADRLHSRFVSLPLKTSPEGFVGRENLCASLLLLPRRDIRPWVLACLDAVPPLHKSSDVISY